MFLPLLPTLNRDSNSQNLEVQYIYVKEASISWETLWAITGTHAVHTQCYYARILRLLEFCLLMSAHNLIVRLLEFPGAKLDCC